MRKRSYKYEFNKLKKLDQVFELALKEQVQTFVKNNIIYKIFCVEFCSNTKEILHLTTINGRGAYKLTVTEVFELL